MLSLSRNGLVIAEHNSAIILIFDLGHEMNPLDQLRDYQFWDLIKDFIE